ncbi:hypothetical protein WCLP8_560001 [uncultured Gammaproteobacteria bacterium]
MVSRRETTPNSATVLRSIRPWGRRHLIRLDGNRLQIAAIETDRLRFPTGTAVAAILRSGSAKVMSTAWDELEKLEEIATQGARELGESLERQGYFR